MTVTNPLGSGPIGQIRFGDEQLSGILPRSKAVALSYTIALSKYSLACALTYTIQKSHVGILQLYYLVTPPQGFAINGDTSIVSPDQVTYTPRQVVAYDLLANPMLGGYASVTWTYTLLQQPEAQYLFQFYNPLSPLVTLVYPDENGIWVQRRAMMQPPTYGSRETVVIQGVILTFLLPT